MHIKNSSFNIDFDVIIIGGGAAGLSAALWCGELGLSPLLLEKNAECGGQLLRVYNPIENHLGIFAADGRNLRDIFLRQTAKRNFQTRLNAEVSTIDFQAKTVVLTNGESLAARALIIATGVRRRRLNIAGETEFVGKGIIESGKKEQLTVANKRVLIVGGGDAALENSLILAETAAQIFVVHRRAEFRGRAEFIEQARRNPRIKLLTQTVITAINGGENVESVGIKNLSTDKSENLPIENILIRIGVEPNTEILRGAIELDENGYIVTDQFGATNVKNIFAAGDAANRISPTVSTAVGTGATAAKAVLEKIGTRLSSAD